MDPIFYHDYPKFVYQVPDFRVVNDAIPPKAFDINAPKKTEKTKKDLKKQEKNKKTDPEKPTKHLLF